VFDSMKPRLPDWLDPNPIAPRVLAHSPSAEFERGLTTWEELRSGELARDSLPDWGYFIGVLRDRMTATRNAFETAERVREELRAGRKNNIWRSAENVPPTHHLEVSAFDLGWRLVPLARWAGRKLDRSDIPRDVEAACRAWVMCADAVWLQLKRQPSKKRNTESHRAMVTPFLNDAQMLHIRVREELCRYGELTDYLRPYGPRSFSSQGQQEKPSS